VRDLLFASKISGTAPALGVRVKMVRDPARLAGEAGRLLLVDLNQPGTIDAAAAWSPETGGHSVGFVSHVDTATVEAARAAGIGQVMARSRFVLILPELLGGTAREA
jgi:hypothetical protein